MKRFLSIFLPVAFLLVAVPYAKAQTPAPVQTVQARRPITLLPECATTSNPKVAGNCGISDILAVLLNLAEYLLGASGAVALGYFVYGGFTMILSRGSSTGVKKGMDILRSAAIGVVIIFLSGVLVRFTIDALTGGASAIPTIGEPCQYNSSLKPSMGTSSAGGDGIWVSLPAGLSTDGKTVIPEGLVCVRREKATKPGDPCENLMGALKDRGLTDSSGESLLKYSCQDPGSGTVSTCVRGLCHDMRPEGQYACCISK